MQRHRPVAATAFRRLGLAHDEPQLQDTAKSG